MKKYLFLGAVLSLTACGGEKVKPLEGEPYVNDSGIQSEVSQQLAESSARSADALETLAMEMRARSAPAKSSIDESQLPPELARHVTTVWNGPAYELVKRIAQDMGYNYLEQGNAGANPGYVSIDAHDEAVAKVLEDIGYQSQAYATIIVNANLKRIEFRNETAESRAGGYEHTHSVRHHDMHPPSGHGRVSPPKIEGPCKPCGELKSPHDGGSPPPAPPSAPPLGAASNKLPVAPLPPGPQMPADMVPVSK